MFALLEQLAAEHIGHYGGVPLGAVAAGVDDRDGGGGGKHGRKYRECKNYQMLFHRKFPFTHINYFSQIAMCSWFFYLNQFIFIFSVFSIGSMPL
jgi:hypothetical protein